MNVCHLVRTSAGGEWALRQMRELVRLGVEVHAALPPGGKPVSGYESAGPLKPHSLLLVSNRKRPELASGFWIPTRFAADGKLVSAQRAVRGRVVGG